MRRWVAVGAAVVLFGAGAAAGYGASLLTNDNDNDHGITDAEHARLLDACIASPDGEGAACAVFVDDLVVEMEAEGCGYSAAVEVLDKMMRNPVAGPLTIDSWYQDATASC